MHDSCSIDCKFIFLRRKVLKLLVIFIADIKMKHSVGKHNH